VSAVSAPEVRLVAVQPDDHEEFFRRFAEYHRELDPYDPAAAHDPWDADQHRRAILDDMEAREIDWIEADGERAGFAMVRTFPDWPDETRDVASIAEFTVFPTFRRRGIGAAAVEALLARHRQRGTYEVEASILPGNDPARAFWARLGFDVRSIVTARRP
jgi:ribosomal protein S18 acetylase RimI-like enzyme